MAVGQITLSLAGCPCLEATDMVSRPSGLIRSESYCQQYSSSSAHPCLSCLSLGRRLSCLAWYTLATTPEECSWRCRSSLRPPVPTDLARRYCTISGGIPTLRWSQPLFRSCSAFRESCVWAVPIIMGTSRRAALFGLPP